MAVRHVEKEGRRLPNGTLFCGFVCCFRIKNVLWN